MEKHYILIHQQEYPYELNYKNMKSIRMKIERGRLIVSAPYFTPLSYIEECLIQYQKKWINQIDRYEPYVVYQDDGYVMIFNQKYNIKVRDVGTRQCQIHGQDLFVYHDDIQKCIEDFLKKVLLDYIEERIIAYLAYDFDLAMPFIEVKKYKSKWGSCFYKMNKVSFNLSLIHLEKQLIDYVIVHELTHFLQANHSPLFYQEIEKRMPDYQIRRKKLKEKYV